MILSSLFCVASGGSLGPEAPLVQVTGSTGTWLGKIFRLKGEELRSLSIAGMASGFTALFGAPLGGSLFPWKYCTINMLLNITKPLFRHW